MIVHIHEAQTAANGDPATGTRLQQIESAVNQIRAALQSALEQMTALAEKVEALQAAREAGGAPVEP